MLKAITKAVFLFFLISNIYLISMAPVFAQNVTGSASVSVTIPARTSNFQFLTNFNTSTSTFSPNSEFEVQITYGSYLPYATNMTIVAQWSQGTVQGLSYPSVDILNYVINSVTPAYYNASPVVDTVNRTITWTIPSFPEQLINQTVKFHLQTNSNYTASQKVNFYVGAYMTAQGITIVPGNMNRDYSYATSTPTSTSTSNPTSTPTPTTTAQTANTSSIKVVSPGPNPISTPASLALKTVNVTTISDENATIYLNTNKKSKFKILYGTSPTALNQAIVDSSLDYEHTVTLPDLSPDTKYYYKIVSTDEKNKTTTSDVFAVKTATVSDAPIIAKDTLIISSGNNILVSQTSQTAEKSVIEQQKTLIIPDKTVYEFKFSLAKIKSVKQVKVIVRKKKSALSDQLKKTVLGAATANDQSQDQQDVFANDLAVTENNSDVNTKETQLTEVQPGVYSGRLASNLHTGDYELVAVVTDSDGNITETTLSQVKIISNFTTLSKTTNLPIEAVRVYLYIYNERTNRYNKILPDVIPIPNPSFTDSHGELSIVLPQGKYRADLADINYKDKTVDFTIGTGKDDGFPIVYLEDQPFNIITALRYYGRSIRDVYFYYTRQYFLTLSKSLRFFNLINAISLIVFVVVTFFSFRLRTHIPLRSMLSYFIYHVRRINGQNMSPFYLEGSVLDGETKKPIGKVNMYLIDGTTHQTINQTSTNINGHFFFKLNDHENYEILAVKNGYEITPFIEAGRETYGKTPVAISLKKSELKSNFFGSILIKLIETLIGYFFEFLLISSFAFEILSLPYFGLQRTLPFLIISGFNFFLWILHLKQKSHIQKAI